MCEASLHASRSRGLGQLTSLSLRRSRSSALSTTSPTRPPCQRRGARQPVVVNNRHEQGPTLPLLRPQHARRKATPTCLTATHSKRASTSTSRACTGRSRGKLCVRSPSHLLTTRLLTETSDVHSRSRALRPGPSRPPEPLRHLLRLRLGPTLDPHGVRAGRERPRTCPAAQVAWKHALCVQGCDLRCVDARARRDGTWREGQDV